MKAHGTLVTWTHESDANASRARREGLPLGLPLKGTNAAETDRSLLRQGCSLPIEGPLDRVRQAVADELAGLRDSDRRIALWTGVS